MGKVVQKPTVEIEGAGGIIRAMREAKGLKPGEVAHALDCSTSFYCDIEHNRRRPSENQADKLSELLGTEADYISLLFGRVPSSLHEAVLNGDHLALRQFWSKLQRVA